MNLIGRFLLALLTARFRQPSGSILSISSRQFRVWPHDLDLNIHLTAARYLSFGDLGRLAWMTDNRLLWRFVTAGYQSVLNAQEITYIREFPPFARMRLDIQLVSWDEKYLYFEQRYFHKDQLYAIGHARSAMLQKRKVLSPQQVLNALGLFVQSPAESEIIADWKATLSAKKRQFA